MYLVEVRKLCILEERFLWMSCRFDNAELYTDHVWNSESKQKENNPRKLNVENNCLFATILKNVFCI